MARVTALIADLLFGSQVQGALTAAGHEVELVPSAGRVRERLVAGAQVLVLDLVDQELGAVALVESLAADGLLGDTGTLGFYSHVDPLTRERAEDAGFDLVVPRSRMAREGAALVSRLATGTGS